MSALEQIDLGIVGDVTMVMKSCCLFDESSRVTGDVTVTEYYAIFHPRGKANSPAEIRFATALVEKIRVVIVDPKNPPKNCPDGFTVVLEFLCKYFRIVSFALNLSSQSPQALASALMQSVLLDKLESSIAMSSYQWARKSKQPPRSFATTWDVYDARAELERQGIFNPNSNWRVTKLNADYSLCDSYPALLCVPKRASDETLKKAAAFRSRNRLTVLSYKHYNHATICRSAQPLPGIIQARSVEDEAVVNAVRDTSPGQGEMHIVDARPLTNAVANHAQGAGYEGTTYQSCQIKFFGIPNIHVTKESHRKLRALLLQPEERDRTHWLAALDGTQWLEYLRLILVAAVFVADKVENSAEPVLSHCSDGWDRTAQIVSLAQLMLDPFYRTLRGFAVLIEKDWCAFGHKFADRCGHIAASPDTSERAPIFLQFIECVRIIALQYPAAFEFNERFLVALLDAVYSCEYGNFLCNNEREARELGVREKTPSVWAHVLGTSRDFFVNPFYAGCDDSRHDVLLPSLHPAHFTLWTIYHLRFAPGFQGAHYRAPPDVGVEQRMLLLNQRLRSASVGSGTAPSKPASVPSSPTTFRASASASPAPTPVGSVSSTPTVPMPRMPPGLSLVPNLPDTALPPSVDGVSASGAAAASTSPPSSAAATGNAFPATDGDSAASVGVPISSDPLMSPSPSEGGDSEIVEL